MDDAPLPRRRRDLRASHDDRDRCVDFLRAHAGDGRLSTDELEDRVGAALTAKTLGDLDDLVVDLPALRPVPVAPPPPPSARRNFQLMDALRIIVPALLFLGLIGPIAGQGSIVLIWLVAFALIGFARRAERRRRAVERAAARTARLARPPVEPASWEPPDGGGHR